MRSETTATTSYGAAPRPRRRVPFVLRLALAVIVAAGIAFGASYALRIFNL